MPETTQAPVIDQTATMEYLEQGLRPEELMFPEYLLLESVELNQHGRIPESELIGAGLQTRQSLLTVRRRYMDELSARGWAIQKMEIEKQSFRILGEKNGETLEIRAVQGTGPTEIFILYHPLAGPA